METKGKMKIKINNLRLFLSKQTYSHIAKIHSSQEINNKEEELD